MISFKTQYEKLVRAYVLNKVKPMNPCACFIGNLLNGCDDWWVFKRASSIELFTEEELELAYTAIYKETKGTYSVKELLQMEGLFMRIWKRYGKNEESLFKAFETTLMLLRQIHESKGESIDSYVFKKRAFLKCKLAQVES